MIASPSAIHNVPSTTSARHLRLSTRAPTRSIASRIMIGRLPPYAADTLPPWPRSVAGVNRAVHWSRRWQNPGTAGRTRQDDA